MITAYKPLALSQCDVDLRSTFIFPKRLFTLSEKDSSQKICFVSSTTQQPKENFFVLPLKIDQQKIDLTLDPALESPLIKRLSEFGGLDAIPEEFRTAMRAYCSQEIINTLETIFQLPISLWEENPPQETPVLDGKVIQFEVLNDDSQVDTRGSMTLPPSLLKNFVSFGAQFPLQQEPQLTSYPLDGEFIIGSAQLSSSQWNSLTSGALVFLKEPSALTSGDAHLMLEKSEKIPLSFDLKLLEPLILPLAKAASSGFTPEPLVEEKGHSSSKSPLKDTENPGMIELAFSAGTISLTIDEILHLTETKTLPRPVKIFRPLSILVQGEAIGAGELVELHGQHAIFITQLNHLS